MCDCRKLIDERLGEKNGRLAFGFTYGTGTLELSPPLIQTEKVNKHKRQSPPIVMATYCPFCGTKLSSPTNKGD